MDEVSSNYKLKTEVMDIYMFFYIRWDSWNGMLRTTIFNKLRTGIRTNGLCFADLSLFLFLR